MGKVYTDSEGKNTKQTILKASFLLQRYISDETKEVSHSFLSFHSFFVITSFMAVFNRIETGKRIVDHHVLAKFHLQ